MSAICNTTCASVLKVMIETCANSETRGRLPNWSKMSSTVSFRRPSRGFIELDVSMIR
jgi:hypothetical protein